MIVHTILYVADQNRSTEFYRQVLEIPPQLNVPGMTEFKLSEHHILGLMPEKGIKKLLGNKLPDFFDGRVVPRVEQYIHVENPEIMFARALELGAKELDSIKQRDWGGKAGYVIDQDGHVLAFAT